MMKPALIAKKPKTKIKKDSDKIKDVRLEIIKKKILDDNSVPKKAFLNAFDYYKKISIKSEIMTTSQWWTITYLQLFQDYF